MKKPWEFENPLCRTIGTDVFFPERDAGWESEIKIAKRICGRCEHKIDCRTYAVETDQVGIWGGTDERDRKRLQRGYRREVSA